MNFEELNSLIPYAIGGKTKSLIMKPHGADSDVTLALPGKHAEDTDPKGGDFVVMVTCSQKKWRRHQFTHIDIFKDIEEKRTNTQYAELMQKDPAQILSLFMTSYLAVVTREDPRLHVFPDYDYLAGLRGGPFLRGAQALAVAEHRRYARFENKFGGRYLPFRFAAGIAEGLWTAADAADKQRAGRPGVEWLEKDHGTPILTKELMNERKGD